MELSKISLITGTGRCGTTWAYKVLERQDVYVGHQTYRHEHTLGEAVWNEDLDFEISFEAAPDAHKFNDLVMLWRDCLKVVSSWMGFGVFCPGWEEDFNYFYRAVKMFVPDALTYETPPEIGAAFWVGWNDMILENSPEAVLPIRGLSARRLLYECGIEPIRRVKNPPVDTNSRPDVKKKVALNWNDLGSVGESVEKLTLKLEDMV